MKTRVAAALAISMIALAAPASSALAQGSPFAYDRSGSYGARWSGTLDRPAMAYDRLDCPMSSAAEGNANQQNFPVKQYGQTSGGNRC